MATAAEYSVRVLTKTYSIELTIQKARLERVIKKSLHDVDMARINLFLTTQEAQCVQRVTLTAYNDLTSAITDASPDVKRKIERRIERSMTAFNQQWVRIIQDTQDTVQRELDDVYRYKTEKWILGLWLEVLKLE